MYPCDRYQIGDDCCGQVVCVPTKLEAFEVAKNHSKKHEPEMRVRVVDLMSHIQQRARCWEVWQGGTSYRRVTDPELRT